MRASVSSVRNVGVCVNIPTSCVDVCRVEVTQSLIDVPDPCRTQTLLAIRVRRRSSASMVDWIHKQTALVCRLVADASLLAEKVDALAMKDLVKNERDGRSLEVRGDAVAAQLHLNPDVELHEMLNAIEIPCVNVDVIDRRCQHEDAVQLTHSVGRQVDRNAVEQGVLQSLLRSMDPNMENRTCNNKVVQLLL